MDIETLLKENKALLFYIAGVQPAFSTSIDGQTLTAGYGKLDPLGWFEYPLPDEIVERIKNVKKG